MCQIIADACQLAVDIICCPFLFLCGGCSRTSRRNHGFGHHNHNGNGGYGRGGGLGGGNGLIV